MDHVPQVCRPRALSPFSLSITTDFEEPASDTCCRRHADRIAHYWLTRLRDSPPPKRLNFIYLVNDIVQNARARKRSEFPDAFSPLMAEAIQTAYRSSPPEIHSKIRRVVEVWRTRNVFEIPILDAIDGRMDEIDKSKGTGTGTKKTLMGNSLFNTSSTTGVPKELETLAPLQIAVTKETISARPAIDTAQVEYLKLNDPAAALPSPPVHAARLSSLIKLLAAAESSVSASIKARKALIADLERILEINKSALAKDDETYLELGSRKLSTEAKKREVEDGIIRGLSSAEAASEGLAGAGLGGELSLDLDNGADNSGFLSERPEIEELTPDREFPDDAFTSDAFFHSPPLPTAQLQPLSPSSAVPRAGNPAVAAALANFSGAPASQYSSLASNLDSASPYSSATTTRARAGSGGPGMNGHGQGYGVKRRKMSHGDDDMMVPDLGEMGMEDFAHIGMQAGVGAGSELDMAMAAAVDEDILRSLNEDVDELLRQEGGGV